MSRAARRGLMTATGLGFLWGLAGYALLWGHTPLVVHRPFVESPAGTVVLLPVRIVLWGIRGAEGLAGHTFDFSRQNGWIGALAGLVGAAIAALLFLGVRAALRVRAR